MRLPNAGADPFAAAALKRGVAVASGAASAPDDLFLDHLRLCCAVEPDLIREGVSRLRAAWSDVCTRQPALV